MYFKTLPIWFKKYHAVIHTTPGNDAGLFYAMPYYYASGNDSALGSDATPAAMLRHVFLTPHYVGERRHRRLKAVCAIKRIGGDYCAVN